MDTPFTLGYTKEYRETLKASYGLNSMALAQLALEESITSENILPAGK